MCDSCEGYTHKLQPLQNVELSQYVLFSGLLVLLQSRREHLICLDPQTKRACLQSVVTNMRRMLLSLYNELCQKQIGILIHACISIFCTFFYGKRTENLKSFTYFLFFFYILETNCKIKSRMSQANLDYNSSTNLQALPPFPQSQLPKSQKNQ